MMRRLLAEDRGYKYFGLENKGIGTNCILLNWIPSERITADTDCDGFVDESGHRFGDAHRMAVYKNNNQPYHYVGCYVDDANRDFSTFLGTCMFSYN